MIRISIDWDFISPTLQVMSGILSIEDFDHYSGPTFILKCKVKKDSNSMGFESLDDKGISCVIFDLFKDQVETMVRGYYNGMNLKEDQYDWVQDSADMSYNEWLDKKGIEKSTIDDEVLYSKKDSEHLKNWNPKMVKKYDNHR